MVTRFLMLIIFVMGAVIVYDQWRIGNLEEKVVALETGGAQAQKEGIIEDGEELADALAKTKKHAENAREMLEGNSVKDAVKEIEKVLDGVETAGGAGKGLVDQVSGYMGDATDGAVSFIEDTLDGLAGDTSPEVLLEKDNGAGNREKNSQKK